jgi:hypothetical protein
LPQDPDDSPFGADYCAVAYNESNSTTIDAIKEARSDKLRNVAPIDTSPVEAMFKSVDK